MALAVASVWGGAPAFAVPSPPPIKPEYVEEWNANQELVVAVIGSPTLDADLERVEPIVRLTAPTPVRIYALDEFESDSFKPEWSEPGSRVKIRNLGGPDPNIWGSGFVRDPLPISIRVRENGQTRLKYVAGTPNQGAGLVDQMIARGEIAAGDVLRIPHLKMDGGDIVAGAGRLYVSNEFFIKNQPLLADSVRTLLCQYLGFRRESVVELVRPPTDVSGHADLLVRTLPNGKVVVSTPGPGMNAADAAALNENLARVQAAVGAANVVSIPTSDSDPRNSYANAVITRNRVLIPALPGDGSTNAAAKAAYETALAGRRVTVMTVDGSDCDDRGGGPRCRVGTLAFAQPNDAAAQDLHKDHRCPDAPYPGAPDPCAPGGGEAGFSASSFASIRWQPPAAPHSVPSPSFSTVAPCLVSCPAGDIPFDVRVRDAGGSPVGVVTVVLEFANCAQALNCSPDGSYGVDPVARTAYMQTDAAGFASFPLQMGGTCGFGTVRVWADGILLATRAMASPDLTGDLVVDDADIELLASPGFMEPGSDLDCDGLVTTRFGTGVDEPPASPTFAVSIGPNPVRAGVEARLILDLPLASSVDVDLLDIAGRRVIAGPRLSLGPGRHTVPWRTPRSLPAGVYTLRLRSDRDKVALLQVIVLR